MDEEPPMGMLTAQVYKGPASIPHASGDFFAAFFLASNVRLNISIIYTIERKHDGVLSSVLTSTCPSTSFQTVLLAHMFPGRVFGSELRPRKYE
jgi:hypothetical protein